MNLIQQIEDCEGRVPHVYKDSLGIFTIAVGINVDESHGGGLLPVEIDFIRDNRIQLVHDEIERLWPWMADLDEPRFAVVVNMIYNLGVTGFIEFHRFLSALQAKNFEAAANEMLNSKWAAQVHRRAVLLAKQMLTGQWQDLS